MSGRNAIVEALFDRLGTLARPREVDGQVVPPEVEMLLAIEARTPRLEDLSVARARRKFRLSRLVDQRPIAMHRVREVDGPVPLRIYRPDAGTLPALLYLHGGGFTIGDLETHDRLCRMLAARGRCVVVSADYRLAPEHPFPAACDDAEACWSWLRASAEDLDLDPNRLAVGGDSAGGFLSAVLCQQVEEKPALQLLIYPALGGDVKTASRELFAEGYLLYGSTMAWFMERFHAEPPDPQDLRAAPGRCKDLAGLPAALVITAGLDPLRDEGQDYARRLEEAGVSVVARNFEGLPHSFAQLGGLKSCRLATEAIGDLLAEALWD